VPDGSRLRQRSAQVSEDDRIEGASAFAQALILLARQALDAECREMWWVSPQLDAWPLDDPLLLDALSAWLKLPQRNLTLLVASTAAASPPSSRPKFVNWYRWRSHAVRVFAAPPADDAALPMLAWRGPGHGLAAGLVRLSSLEPWRGRVVRQPDEVRVWRDSVDVVLQRSEPAWPVTTLGI
jgi:hypothetical protein